jgi:hypothetical protein
MGVTREIGDYLRRYKPDTIVYLGRNPLGNTAKPSKVRQLHAASADEAAVRLARSFWQSSNRVVLCREGDYPSALMAAVLASRLGAPLLWIQRCSWRRWSSNPADA